MGKIVFLDDVHKIIEFLPDDRMNPVESEYSDSCVYTDYNGNHCIAGQIMTILGFKVPKVDDHNNVNPIHQVIEDLYPDVFDDDAIEILQIGQNTADKLTHYDEESAWGFAKKDMIDFYNRRIAKEN
jgi:hypothetical protein